jgi:hypothetical protein
MIWTRLLQRLKRARVRRVFEQNRQELQANFLRELQGQGSAEAVWEDVEWITDPVIFVRQDRAEPYYALVGVSAVSSATPEDGGKVHSQAGTAVFHFTNGAWGTTGQMLANLTPSEALEKLMHQFMQPGC